jgi:uncharacterized membrane protein
MLILVRLSAGWGRWLWPAGALALALKPLAELAHGQWPALEFLNQPLWNWLGLISRKPITEDYVPLVPWLGVIWWGTAAGQALLSQQRAWGQRRLPGMAGPLAWLGRWSLSLYMVHQPVLIGALTLAAYAARR